MIKKTLLAANLCLLALLIFVSVDPPCENAAVLCRLVSGGDSIVTVDAGEVTFGVRLSPEKSSSFIKYVCKFEGNLVAKLKSVDGKVIDEEQIYVSGGTFPGELLEINVENGELSIVPINR